MRLLRRDSDWSLFDDFLNSFTNDRISRDSRLMAVDVLENDEGYQVMANLPGVKREDLKITVKANELLLETCPEKVDNEQKKIVHMKERYDGCYQRVIKLPENCDQDSIKANLKNGVLTISIPKADPKPDKTITIE